MPQRFKREALRRCMVKELSSQAGGAVCREGGGMVLLEGMVVR